MKDASEFGASAWSMAMRDPTFLATDEDDEYGWKNNQFVVNDGLVTMVKKDSP